MSPYPGKVTVYGTHPTRYGYTTEQILKVVPVSDFETYGHEDLARLEREGFEVTAVAHPLETGP